MKFSKTHIFIFLVSVALTISLGWILLPSNKNSDNIYIRQNYDFRKLRLNNSDIDSLKIGSKLELANIKNTRGKTLSSFPNEKLFLLIAADPFCPACNFSKDMIEEVRNTAESIKIPYYPIAVSPTKENSDMANYTKNSGFEDYLYWSAESSPAIFPLSQLITPTHILIDKNGTVIQIWYGSNKDASVRKTMSNQISADLLLINDIFEAQANNGNIN